MIEEQKTYIKEKYSSICYDCAYARNPASEELTKEGWVGCCIRLMGYDYDKIVITEEIAEGWVKTKNEIFDDTRNVMINLQLLTKQTKECKCYHKMED